MVVKRLALFGSILWLLVVAIDYAVRSEHFFLALGHFKFITVPILHFTILSFATLLFFVKKPWNKGNLTIKSFRPIYYYPAVLISMLIFLVTYSGVNSMDINFVGFLSQVLKIHFLLLVFVLSSFSIGHLIISKLNVQTTLKYDFFISLALGWVVLGMVLFILGAFGILSSVAVWVLLLICLISGMRQVRNLVVKSWIAKQKPFKVNIASLLLVILAILFVAINSITNFSPVPLGFDSLNLYMNISKLVSEQGSLISGHQPYNWSLMSSLGYLMNNNNALAIHISNITAVISIFLIYRLSRLFLSANWSIFSAVAFYTLPVVIWQSAFEGKVDLAALYFGLTSILWIVQYYLKATPQDQAKKYREIKFWSLLGVLCGYMIGIKLSAVILIFVLIIYFLYHKMGGKAAWAGAFWLLAIVFFAELYHFTDFDVTRVEKYILVSLTATVGLVFSILSYRSHPLRSIRVFFPLIAMIISSSFLFMPWAIKNSLEHGAVSMSKIIEGKSDTELLSRRARWLPSAQTIANKGEHSIIRSQHVQLENETGSSAKYEEIRRYLGYEGGVMHFISLPYDLTMKANVKMWGSDPGILLLFFLPLLIFTFYKKNNWLTLSKFIIVLLWLVISIWSATVGAENIGFDKAMTAMKASIFTADGNILHFISPLYYGIMAIILRIGSLLAPLNTLLTSPSDGVSLIYALLCIPVFYFLFKDILRGNSKAEKGVVFLLFWYFIFWLLLASGIIWYGLIGISLSPLFISLIFFNNKDSLYNNSKVLKYVCLGILGIWFVLLIPFRLSPMELNTLNINAINFNHVVPPQTVQYASGEIPESEVTKSIFNRETNVILDELNSNPDAKVINISTFLKFFIKNNNKRLYKDDQIDMLTALWNSTNYNKLGTAVRLKSMGIEYILIGLDAASLDNTPEQSLKVKFEGLMRFLYNNEYIELISTDRYVVDPNGPIEANVNGQRVKVKADIFGRQVVQSGKLALFKLK